MVSSQLHHLLWPLHPPRSQGFALVHPSRRFLPSLQDPDDFEIMPRSGYHAISLGKVTFHSPRQKSFTFLAHFQRKVPVLGGGGQV